MQTTTNEMNWRLKLEALEGAYASETLRAYKADFGLFEEWCLAAGLEALPAAPELVAGFVSARASHDLPSTIRRRLSAIRKVHRICRLPSPVDDEEVRTAYRRVARSRGRRPAQAHGLTIDLRERLLEACPVDRLAGLRDRAIIAVGDDTLCRRSELVALTVADLTRDEAGGMNVLVRRSKADPLGDGRTAFLTPRTVTLLDAWLDTAGIDTGPLFRSLANGRLGEAHLDPGTVGRILKRAAPRAGCEAALVAVLSGHSMRVGGAQDMATSEFDIPALLAAGGWKTVAVVARYVEKAQAARVGQTPAARIAASSDAAREDRTL